MSIEGARPPQIEAPKNSANRPELKVVSTEKTGPSLLEQKFGTSDIKTAEAIDKKVIVEPTLLEVRKELFALGGEENKLISANKQAQEKGKVSSIDPEQKVVLEGNKSLIGKIKQETAKWKNRFKRSPKHPLLTGTGPGSKAVESTQPQNVQTEIQRRVLTGTGFNEVARQEQITQPKPTEVKLTGTGEGSKVGERGSVFEQQQLAVDRAKEKWQVDSVDPKTQNKEASSNGNLETEKTKQISHVNESGEVVMIGTDKKVSDLSDADIMIKANGYLGIREAAMNVFGSMSPKAFREGLLPRDGNGKLDAFVAHPDNPVKASWRFLKTFVDPRSYKRDFTMRDAVDHGDSNIIGKVRSGEKWDKPEFAVQRVDNPSSSAYFPKKPLEKTA
jgi:hypothetical protein